MEDHLIFNGKINYFDWAIFNSYFDITRGQPIIMVGSQHDLPMVNQLWMLQVKLAEYDTTQTYCKQHEKSATNGALIHCHVLVICVYIRHSTLVPCWAPKHEPYIPHFDRDPSIAGGPSSWPKMVSLVKMFLKSFMWRVSSDLQNL